VSAGMIPLAILAEEDVNRRRRRITPKGREKVGPGGNTYKAVGPSWGVRHSEDRMRFQEKNKPWNNSREIAS
jgi:hypothetical protein